MKNKLFWLILILTGCAILFSVIKGPQETNQEFQPLEMEVGDTFSFLSYPNTMYVLNYMIKDVTGDGTTEMLIVIGEKDAVDAMQARNMDLIVYEPNEAQFYPLKMKNVNGMLPQLQICELTGDTLPEVILLVNDEKEQVFMRIASFQNGEWKEIWKARDNKGLVLQGEFLDGMKAHVKKGSLNKEFLLDLKDRKENYVVKRLLR